MINWIILSGLPASGKTSWAKRFEKTHSKLNRNWSYANNYCRIVSTDILGTLEKNELDFSKPGWYYCETDHFVIVDGLFLTNDAIIRLISTIPTEMIKSITIIQWRENREICLKNDHGRRLSPAAHSIRTLPLEKPDSSLIKEKTGVDVRVKFKDVKEYLARVDEFGCIVSSTFSVNEEIDIPEEIPDLNLPELDSFLNENYPFLTYKEYLEIVKPLIRVKSIREFDYYKGESFIIHYSINYNKLIAALEGDDLTEKIIDSVLERYNKDGSYGYFRYDDRENEFFLEKELKEELEKNNLRASYEFKYGVERPNISCDAASISWTYRGKLKNRLVMFIMH